MQQLAKRIYLDNAATTPLSEAAAAAMAPYMQPGTEAPFGNANSLHTVGRDAFRALEDARAQVARTLRASRPNEIVFTSGATEADNAALVGIALGAAEQARLAGRHDAKRIVMSRIEHDAVLHASKMLTALGFEVCFVENDADARVTPEALASVVDENTLLVSVMAANNEVGTVNDVAALAKAAHAAGALFHTDAVQALGKIPVDLKAWGVDAASFSAHKVGGPKGVGILYLKTKTPFSAYLQGGGQEGGLRSGTQNVVGIVGLAAAFADAVSAQPAFAAQACELRDYLYERLAVSKRVVATVHVPVQSDAFLPNIVNVCVKGVESQTLILQLDARGICVSGGSACSSASLAASHVLSAMDVPASLAQGELRISFSPSTTREDVDAFLNAFFEVVR